MSLEHLFHVSRIFPPGHLSPEKWPRLSGSKAREVSPESPRYCISESLSDRLLSYYEDAIYFDYTPSNLEPDSVWDVSASMAQTFVDILYTNLIFSFSTNQSFV